MCEICPEGAVGTIVLGFRGGGMPRPPEFHTQKQRSVSLPCVGGGGSALADSEGVYGSNFVGDYRTMAFIVSIAYTPSVMACAMTAQ